MRRARGITLIELLVVLSLIAILAAISVPLFSEWIARERADAAAQAFALALTRARSDSLARGQRVVVAPLTGGWAGGWRVFIDGDRDGDFVADADPDDGVGSGDIELVLHEADVTVVVSPDFGAGWGERIVFLPGGYVRDAAGASLAGRMGFGAPAVRRSVCLTALGRVVRVLGDRCPA